MIKYKITVLMILTLLITGCEYQEYEYRVEQDANFMQWMQAQDWYRSTPEPRTYRNLTGASSADNWFSAMRQRHRDEDLQRERQRFESRERQLDRIYNYNNCPSYRPYAPYLNPYYPH
ncbi:hypothetical protein LCGC14_2772910 [marine sediment metagenome]|uniref:Lipoprotein n=1 Tax=marine sediment metagenome TaxID=412755 RepID=A0A0F8YVL5_9ZZZZ